MSALRVAGRGEARKCARAAFDVAARANASDGDRKAAEAALGAIRYADPASFTVATAAARALAARRADVLAAHDRVGVIAISPDGPLDAIAGMNAASREGSSSPIRFPASNAGSLAGLTAIGFTLRGPTLMLTLSPARGVPVGAQLSRAFLGRGAADFLLLGTCVATADGPAARCLLLEAGAGVADDEALAGALSWLTAPEAAAEGTPTS